MSKKGDDATTDDGSTRRSMLSGSEGLSGSSGGDDESLAESEKEPSAADDFLEDLLFELRQKCDDRDKGAGDGYLTDEEIEERRKRIMEWLANLARIKRVGYRRNEEPVPFIPIRQHLMENIQLALSKGIVPENPEEFFAQCYAGTKRVNSMCIVRPNTPEPEAEETLGALEPKETQEAQSTQPLQGLETQSTLQSLDTQSTLQALETQSTLPTMEPSGL